MVINAERLESRIHKPKASVLAFFAAGALIAGCSSQGKENTGSNSKTSTDSTVSQTNNSNGNYIVPTFNYINSLSRAARVHKAMQAFGQVVINQWLTHGSAWSPLDVYCSSNLQDAQNQSGGGWLSQGYKPTAKQDCAIQQTDVIGMNAVVTVNANGDLTNNVVAASIVDSNCQLSIANSRVVIDGKWNDTIPLETVTFGTTSYYLGDSQSLSQAEWIDNQAIACLNKARP